MGPKPAHGMVPARSTTMAVSAAATIVMMQESAEGADAARLTPARFYDNGGIVVADEGVVKMGPAAVER